MRHPILIAALAFVTIGAGAARADEHDEALMAHRQPQRSNETVSGTSGLTVPCIEVAGGCYGASGRNSDGEVPDATIHPETLKVAEMESHERDDDDDEDGDDEDDGEHDATGGSSTILPIPQSGAPATVPAPKNPLINGNARPSVVVQ